MHPDARHDDVLVYEVGDELIVYDPARHRAHRLNRAAALVWRHADGRTGVAALAALLARELGVPANEDVVWLALDRLADARLLHRRPRPPHPNLSRREVVRRLGMAGAAAALLPAVASVTAPTPLMAQYRPAGGCPSSVAVTPQSFQGSGGTLAEARAEFNARVRAFCDAVCRPFDQCDSILQSCLSVDQAVDCVQDPPGNFFCERRLVACNCACA